MSAEVARASLYVVLLAMLLGEGAASQQIRDTVPPPAIGAATIVGVVVDDAPSPRPLRRAIVTVSGSEIPTGRSAITDDEGRFAFQRVPAGRVTIAVVKRGYVTGAFGATRPGRPGTPVQLRAGQTLDATIRLSRTGVLAGLIRDERGKPIPGLRVFAINGLDPVAPAPVSGEGTAVPTALTDDRGIYRLYDLAPGEYIIAATPTSNINNEITRRSELENDALLARLRQRAAGTPVTTAAAAASLPAATLAPVYFPGTALLNTATRIKLGAGEVRDALDFTMTAVPVTTIEGTVVSDGPMPSSIEMSIAPVGALRFFALGGANPQLVQKPGADGRFRYSTIVPGHYVIFVRANVAAPAIPAGGRGDGRGGPAGNTTETMYATQDFEVAGQPVTGLALRLRRGSRFAGRLVFDAASQPVPADLTTIRVSLQAVGGGNMSTINGTRIGNSFGQVPPVSVAADGTFEIAGLPPGEYRPQVTIAPVPGQRWWFRSAVVSGRDALDSQIDIVLGTDLTGAMLTVTDRYSELSGTLQTASGSPAPEYFVIVLPAEAGLRTAGSRRVRSTRPATDGTFSFADLPAGDYLLVALTDVEPNEWQKPEFLAAIAPAGVKVVVSDGAKTRQDLRIGG